MSTRSRVAVLVSCVVLVLLAAWYAGAQHAPSGPTPATGTIRLGPEAGEDMAGYLARLLATLPPDGARAPALVQIPRRRRRPGGARRGRRGDAVTAVFRVPLPRVQTALRFVALEPGCRSRRRWTTPGCGRSGRPPRCIALTGRPGAVAAAEAAVLGRPDCRCVVALVVDGDREALSALAGRAPVRAVEAAPPGTAEAELALSPLLPEQTTRADPPPDDGPVPAAP